MDNDETIRKMKTEEKLLTKYKGRYGIRISVSELERNTYVISCYSSRCNSLDIGSVVIDYCVSECIIDLRIFLKKIRLSGRRGKVARRWLGREMKYLKFGNTGYCINDFLKEDGNINIEEVRRLYDCNEID